MSDDEHPDFGPGGYLPDRAARQARKIILRAPLGLQWLVAAVVFGVVLLVAGTLFLATRGDDAPPSPFVEVVELTSLPEDGLRLAELDALIVRDGVVRVFADVTERDLVWCPASDRVEGADGAVWTRTGRGLGGVASLDTLPNVIHEGIVFVDPTRRVPGPSPDPEPAASVCLRQDDRGSQPIETRGA